MNRKLLVYSLLLVVLLAAGVPTAFAQAREELSIQCNVAGARVYINGELAGSTNPVFVIQLRPGTYTVRVQMERYQVFEKVITLGSSPLRLSVKLAPEGATQQQQGRFNLTVTSNVADARVYVNNSSMGTAPLTWRVNRGSYSLRVSAPGYQDYEATVKVTRSTTVNAVLQAILLQLTVRSNVAGAQVYVNNSLAGTVPYTGGFAPGSYTLRVRAPGYSEESTVVDLNRSQTVTISLQPSLVSVRIVIPPGFLSDGNDRNDNNWNDNNRNDNDRNDNDRNDRNSSDWNNRDQVRLYVDGQFSNSLNISVAPGRHNIRISSGAFSFDADFDFQQGRAYVLEPAFTWKVR